MTDTEKYVRKYLSKELAKVQQLTIATVDNGLDIYEKTVVFYYTRDGYRSINESLRRNKKPSKICDLLTKVLAKLPDHRGLVHRTARLTAKHIQVYRKSLKNGTPVIEKSFLSTSKSPLTARLYPEWNVKFQIISKHGKSIEEMSYMGMHSPPNEEEVLFTPSTQFTIADVTNMGTYLLIKTEEI